MAKLLGIGEAAELLGMSVSWLRANAANLGLSELRLVSGHRRFVRAEVEGLVGKIQSAQKLILERNAVHRFLNNH